MGLTCSSWLLDLGRIHLTMCDSFLTRKLCRDLSLKSRRFAIRVTRETLLSRVWGYDYYGGARTVDVHIRRLRAKLGEVHAGLIHTVRSVGYRFGQSRWGVQAP